MLPGDVPSPATVDLTAQIQDANVSSSFESLYNRAREQLATVDLFLCGQVPGRCLHLLERLSLALYALDDLLFLIVGGRRQKRRNGSVRSWTIDGCNLVLAEQLVEVLLLTARSSRMLRFRSSLAMLKDVTSSLRTFRVPPRLPEGAIMDWRDAFLLYLWRSATASRLHRVRKPHRFLAWRLAA